MGSATDHHPTTRTPSVGPFDLHTCLVRTCEGVLGAVCEREGEIFTFNMYERSRTPPTDSLGHFQRIRFFMTKPRKPSRSGRLWGLPPGEQVFAHELRGSQPWEMQTKSRCALKGIIPRLPPKEWSTSTSGSMTHMLCAHCMQKHLWCTCHA